ncbi:uncharacterized protein LOC108864047 [Galendromus occidentalis]|uniref:Uncharacterized protein LOC108864047 n=1 Tax=Galendromus occidentalis TaxID=34638 RepID=A0AAJ7L391_9ACAR|nr:uncharacterized protein LOC108864047 [Galendromus occidentalis]
MNFLALLMFLCPALMAAAGSIQELGHSKVDLRISEDYNTSLEDMRGLRDVSEDSSRTVCFGELGCFNDSIGMKIPEDPTAIPPFYVLVSSEKEEVRLRWNDEDRELRLKTAGYFGEERHLIFVAHGFGESSRRPWMWDLKDAALKAYPGANIVIIDWREGADAPDYDQASANVAVIATMTAALTQSLMLIHPKIKAENIYFIGFSLGAQMAGFYARAFTKRTGRKIGRITSLDAAGPNFEAIGVSPRRGEADFVEAIHTSLEFTALLGRVGYYAAYGDIDFYPNGGTRQAGCLGITCSHERAYHYLIEALNDVEGCQFKGLRCKSAVEAEDGNCNGHAIDTYIVNLLELESEFLDRLGEDLLILRLEKCDWSLRAFYTILRYCKHLRVLDFSALGRRGARETLRPVENVPIDHIRLSSPLVRSLSLREVILADGELNHLLDSLPNLEQIAVHAPMHVNVSSRGTLICLLRAEQTFKKLDFAFDSLDPDVVRLIEKYADSLVDLRLDSCKGLLPEAYRSMSDCRNLRVLVLREPDALQDRHLLKILGRAPELEFFYVTDAIQLTNAAVEHIDAVGKFRCIPQSRIETAPDILQIHGTFPPPQDMMLTVGNAHFSHSIPSMRGNFRTIIVYGPNSTRECIAWIAKNFGKVEEFKIECYPPLSDDTAHRLSSLKSLRKLSLIGARWFSDEAFARGIGSSAMETLEITDCPLTDKGLASLAAHHGRLRRFHLTNCNRVTDTGISSLLRGEPFLEALELTNCDLLTENCLSEMRKSCPHLVELTVNCPKITQSFRAP